MTNQLDITNLIASLFPLEAQIEYIKSHTNKSGGTLLPAMDDDGTLYHQRLRREIVPLTLNFVNNKDESLNWEKRFSGHGNIMKRFEEDSLYNTESIKSLNFFMMPGLGSLALGLFHAADIKNDTNINILLPKEDTGFVTYNQEQDALYFVVEYSLNQEESYLDRLGELKKLIETNPKCVLRVLDGLTTKERDGTTLLEIVVSIYAKEKYTEDKKSLYAVQKLLKKVIKGE